MSGFNGNGIFSNEFNWTNDAANGIDILASRMDGQDGTIATGLSTCICRDGQSTTTAAITFAQGVTVSAGTLGTPSINIISDTDTGLAQVSGAGTMAFISNGSKILTFSGTGINGPVGGTTAAAGAFTTLAASGATALASTLAVTSTSTLTGAVSLGSTINKITLTAPASSATLTIANAKTLTVSNTLTLAGTDSTVMTFPGTSDTVVTLAATQTLTNKTFALGTNSTTAKTSWTPVLNFGGGTIGITYSTQSGTYVQIGKLIVAEFIITLTSKGSSTGGATITGLPTAANGNGNMSISFYTATSGNSGAAMNGSVGSSTITLRYSTPTGNGSIVDTDFTNTTTLGGTCIYIAT